MADEDSIVGTENAGIISLDVVAGEAEAQRRGGGRHQGDSPHGRHGSTDTGTTEKDSQ